MKLRTLNLVFQSLLAILLLASTSVLAQTPVSNDPQITGVELIDAATDEVVSTLVEGATIKLSDFSEGFNIKAITDPVEVGSVVFSLNGDVVRTENVAPYALFGDRNADFNNGFLTPGSYTLEATAFTRGQGNGQAGNTFKINFEVVAGDFEVNEFLLVNAETDEVIRPLNDNDRINISNYPNGINIVAVTNPAEVGSVQFMLNGKISATENIVPYALAGDIRGDFRVLDIAVGTFELKATPFSQRGARGNAGEPLTINFEVFEGDAIVRLFEVDSETESITIKNFGNISQDVSAFWFCLGPGRYNQLNNYSTISGDLILDPNEELTFDLTSGGGNVTALADTSALALFSTNVFGSSDPSILLDFIQFGAANQARVGQAVDAGRWSSAEDFVAGAAPFNYVGGANDLGSRFWIDNTNIRLVQITPAEDIITLKNFDEVARDLSGYFFCTLAGVYPSFADSNQVEIIEGDLYLAPGEEITVRVLTTGGVVDGEGSIFLFSSNVLGFNNQNASVTRDFAQWGAPNGFRVDNAVAVGRWDDAANFIEGGEPFTYIGGANDIGGDFWEGIVGQSIVRLFQVDSETESITIKNFGDASQDVSGYWFCLGPGRYNNLAAYTNISGDLMLAPNEELTFDLTSGTGNVTELGDTSALALFSTNVFGSSDPEILLDFLQYGAANQARVGQAVDAGRWSSAEDFVMGNAPFNYIGGANDLGSEFWEATVAGEAIIRLFQVDSETESITIKNFGDASQDVSGYWFCLGPGRYNNLAAYTNISGDLMLAPNEELTFDLTSGTGNVTELGDTSALALFSTNVFGSSDPEILLDFLQYGAANQARVGQAVDAGRWSSAEDFVMGNAPFNYIGGANDLGSEFWEATVAGEAIIRLFQVDSETESITIKNFGDASQDVSGYWFCLGPGRYNNLAAYTNISGDLMLAPNEELTFDLTSGTGNVTELGDTSALALFSTNVFGSSDPEILLDFLQYGAANQARVGQAVDAGRWSSAEDFVMGNAPFNYIGGANDLGSEFWEATVAGEAIIRLFQVDSETESITIKNFGDASQDVSGYWFCLGPGRYNNLAAYTNISGDLMLAPNEELTFDLTSGTGNVTELGDTSALALFSTNVFGSSDPEILLDFLQYGAANQARVGQAVDAGRWSSAEDFVAGLTPFNYTGGANDLGSEFWEAVGVGEAVIRITAVDPISETVTLKNFGNASQNIASYWFCLGPGRYNQLNDYSSIIGDLDLAPNEEVTFNLPSGGNNVTALDDNSQGLGLFANSSFGSSNPADLKDYVQYGAANQSRVGQAVTAGRWPSASEFVGGASPYTFNGGSGDIGADFWSAAAQINVYPNPSQGNLNIQGNDNASFQIIDNQGKLIRSGDLKNGEGRVTLPEGIFFIRSGNEVKRVIVK